MGRYDARAQVAKIKEMTSTEKILYLGYSQGTTQMFYGLSKYEEEFYADSLLKFAAFAPCIRFAQQDKKVWERSIFKYDDLEIYHFGGLDQIENVSKICTNIPRNCMQSIVELIMQPSSVQSVLHYAQCSIEQRFQEYSPTYEQGDTQTTEIPLNSIDKVPIAMWVGEADKLCDLKQAEVIRDTIGDAVKYFKTIPNEGHMYFASANSEDFVNDVINQLKTGYERPSSSFLN